VPDPDGTLQLRVDPLYDPTGGNDILRVDPGTADSSVVAHGSFYAMALVPEPSSFALGGAAAGALAGASLRRRRGRSR
jgi:hypothetical protein